MFSQIFLKTDTEMDIGLTTTPPTSSTYFHDYSFDTNLSRYVDFYDDDFSSSTGYLEDVLFEFSSKRRRLEYNDNVHLHDSNKDFMSSDLCGNFDTLDQIINLDKISDMKTHEEAISETYDSSSSTYKESTANQWITSDDGKENQYCNGPKISSGENVKTRKKKITSSKVVYPFDVVKPGGFEGDATLNDINERILMPPTRAVRHPVGDYACKPLVSPQGPGLSGKAVVAFTKVHTQGRGTITIIRTKG